MPKRASEKEDPIRTGDKPSLIRIFLDKVKSFFVGLWEFISSWLTKPNKTSSKVQVSEPVVTKEEPIKETRVESETKTTELVETKPAENVETPQAVQKVEEPAKQIEVVVDPLLEEARKAQLKIEEENRQKQQDEQRKAEEQQAAEQKKFQEMREHAETISGDVPLSYFLTQHEKEKLKKLRRDKLAQELDLISNMSQHLEQSLRTFAPELLSQAQDFQGESGSDNTVKEKMKRLESTSKYLEQGLEVRSLFDYRMRISWDGSNIIANGPPNPSLYIGNLILNILEKRAELELAVNHPTIPTAEQIETNRQEVRKLVGKIEKDSKLLNYTDLSTIPLRIELATLNRVSRFKITDPAMYFVMIKQMAKIQAMLDTPKEELPVGTAVDAEVTELAAEKSEASTSGSNKLKNR